MKIFIRRTSIKVFLGLSVIIGIIFVLSLFILDPKFLLLIVNNFIVLLAVLFVDDIRNVLYKIGTWAENIFKTIFRGLKKKEFKRSVNNSTITEISESCFEMTKNKTGALIVFEKDSSLEEFETNAIMINATNITAELMLTVFNKNTPLHDGAVIIKNNRLVAAGCFLPNTKNTQLDRSYGTRHRAAIGVTENMDCVVVLVSEEKGSVHIVREGRVSNPISDAESLMNLLQEYLEGE